MKLNKNKTNLIENWWSKLVKHRGANGKDNNKNKQIRGCKIVHSVVHKIKWPNDKQLKTQK